MEDQKHILDGESYYKYLMTQNGEENDRINDIQPLGLFTGHVRIGHTERINLLERETIQIYRKKIQELTTEKNMHIEELRDFGIKDDIRDNLIKILSEGTHTKMLSEHEKIEQLEKQIKDLLNEIQKLNDSKKKLETDKERQLRKLFELSNQQSKRFWKCLRRKQDKIEMFKEKYREAKR